MFSLRPMPVSRGSPPHMRGKVLSRHRPHRRRGITPAHAGKRSAWRSSASPGRDHPRTCGEKRKGHFPQHGSRGSPPHMRGKDLKPLVFVYLFRITPAHAGKSEEVDAGQQEDWDHPRTCGEKSSPTVMAQRVPGSPPHMRGKDTGYISCAPFAVDHPRTCGEKSKEAQENRHFPNGMHQFSFSLEKMRCVA